MSVDLYYRHRKCQVSFPYFHPTEWTQYSDRLLFVFRQSFRICLQLLLRARRFMVAPTHHMQPPVLGIRAYLFALLNEQFMNPGVLKSLFTVRTTNDFMAAERGLSTHFRLAGSVSKAKVLTISFICTWMPATMLQTKRWELTRSSTEVVTIFLGRSSETLLSLEMRNDPSRFSLTFLSRGTLSRSSVLLRQGY